VARAHCHSFDCQRKILKAAHYDQGRLNLFSSKSQTVADMSQYQNTLLLGPTRLFTFYPIIQESPRLIGPPPYHAAKGNRARAPLTEYSFILWDKKTRLARPIKSLVRADPRLSSRLPQIRVSHLACRSDLPSPNIRSRRPYGGRARKRPRSRPLLTAVGHTAVGHIKYTPRPAPPPPALIRSSHCAIRSRP